MDYGPIVNEGSLILRYRTISFSKHIYDRINDNELILKSNVPLKKYNPLGIQQIHITTKLYPNSIRLEDYGILITSDYNYNNEIYSLYQYTATVQILVKDILNEDIIVRKCIVLKNKTKLLVYSDIISNKLENFIRYLGNKKLLFSLDGQLLNMESNLNCKFITHDKIDLIYDTNILTFDIECYLHQNNKFIAYACGYSDGNNSQLYYITDNSNMLYQCIYDILLNYNNYTVYVHNFSNFDYYFILAILKDQTIIKSDSFYKDNKLYSLKLTIIINKKVHAITIKDSYLLLPNSLRKLGHDYKVNTLKGYFPYSFVKNNNLNYIGNIPEYSYYKNNISESMEYNEYLSIKNNYSNNNWSIKEETLKYLKSDLLCLYQVINQFGKDIFNLENMNITKSLSISSLTFKIFKTNYLKDYKLPIIKGIHHDRMRDGFYGGHVDVYKSIGKHIKCYDVNSLYPFVMSINDFPVGNPIFSFDKDLNNYFGLVHCKIQTPEYMEKPVLPFRGDDGTIYYPLGT
jgi:hypothetical protein